MRHKPLFFALLLALPVAGHASPDRIEGWSGGEAQVMSYSPGGPVALGTIAADGTVTLALPESPPKSQPLGQTFPSCREDGAAIATPEATAFVPTSLFASRAGEELGSLTLTAECVQTTYTDSEATDSYPQTTDYRVTLAPGWNLLRFSITSLHADPTGRNHPRLTEVEALAEAPEDAQWFFEAR